ncbi:hypothetical protein FRB90_005663 [Tulasnella sp. 427]|nr:hypothetical protein FRB90_005663 [Tulasnella sp. 427]
MPSRALLIAAAVRQTGSQCATNSRPLTEGGSYRSTHTSHAPRNPNVNPPGTPTATSTSKSHHPTSSLGFDSPPTTPTPASYLASHPLTFDTQSTHPLRKHHHPTRPMQSASQRMFSANTEWRNFVEKEMGPEFFKDLAKGQSPKLLWIGCADSRVPETIVMAAKPGDIFVHRNIANQFHLSDDSARSVLTYAVDFLNVQTIAVVGHTKCGGAAACLGASKEPAKSDAGESALGRWLGPMTDLARSLDYASLTDDQALDKLVEENVKAQVANVIRTDTIQNAWKDGKDVTVHGWVFEIEHGKIRDLGISASKDTVV